MSKLDRWTAPLGVIGVLLSCTGQHANFESGRVLTPNPCLEFVQQVRDYAEEVTDRLPDLQVSRQCPMADPLMQAAAITRDVELWPIGIWDRDWDYLGKKSREKEKPDPDYWDNARIERTFASALTRSAMDKDIPYVLTALDHRSASQNIEYIPDSTLQLWLGELPVAALLRRFEQLTTSLKAEELAREVQMVKTKLSAFEYAFWRARAHFILREYEEALKLLVPKTDTTQREQRQRELWKGRSLARLGRLQEAGAIWKGLSKQADNVGCESAYRESLVAGYEQNYKNKLAILDSAVERCAGIGWTQSMGWEKWTTQLALEQWKPANQTMRSMGELFESARWIRGNERPFWVCYSPDSINQCIEELQDPYLPYTFAEGITTGPRPAWVNPETIPDPTLDPILTLLQQSHWIDLYRILLAHAYQKNPYDHYGFKYIDYLYQNGLTNEAKV